MRKRLEWRGKDGSVRYTSLPLPVWLIDEWFGRSHPHWEWWSRLWMRVLPNWGDPFCAAYCFVFTKWVYDRPWHREEP